MYFSIIDPHFASYPPPGAAVSVPIGLGYRHKGIVSDQWYDGKPMVISNSARAGGVYEEPWDEFAGGREVRNEKLCGDFPPHVIISRARSFLGTKYDLLNWNCDHLVTEALGLNRESPQLQATVAVLALTLGAFAITG